MRREYVVQDRLEQVVGTLSQRDQAILLDLARVRVLSGEQVTRLHFMGLASSSRERSRRRVLARLAEHQLAATLERVIGGSRSGSSGLVYALGVAGQRALPLLEADAYTDGTATRTRTPWTPGSRFLAHSLAISEMYVCLRERERAGELGLGHYCVESAAWHPDGRGGVIKPDAYVRIHRREIEDCWWIEVDRATESIPTLRRKLLAYVEFARTGQGGPDGIMPRVLVTVPHDHRLAAVRTMISSLPPPAAELIFPVLHGQAATLMIDILRA
jgi:Replication-relaxation